VIPLYCEAYSFLAEDVKSENSQLLKLIDTIFRHLEGRGIHAMDRVETEGFFTRNILAEEAEAICDSFGGSGFNPSGEAEKLLRIIQGPSDPYETVLIVYEDGKERKRTVHYNAIPVKLPSYGHKLYLVVVKGSGKSR